MNICIRGGLQTRYSLGVQADTDLMFIESDTDPIFIGCIHGSGGYQSDSYLCMDGSGGVPTRYSFGVCRGQADD